MCPNSPEEESDQITTIQLKKKTRATLKNLVEKRETYDDLLLRLIEEKKKGEMKMNEYEKEIEKLRQERKYGLNPFLPSYPPSPPVETEIPPVVPPTSEETPDEDISGIESVPDEDAEGSDEPDEGIEEETPMPEKGVKEHPQSEPPTDGWIIHKEGISMVECQAAIFGLGPMWETQVIPSTKIEGLVDLRIRRKQ